jgi:hypothetical protein
MGRYAKRELHPLSEIAVIDQATIDLIASEIPPSGLTISQVKADTDIADSLTKKHSAGSDNQNLSGKQDVLISGTNIKTINSTSILGSGNIIVEGGLNQQQILRLI